MFFLIPGGIGLFLLGMICLTEGLRGIAGNALRRLLAKFTKTPTTGAIAGAITTALIQSSSATTVTAIGFVGAGLLTFRQALGVIFGANIGTTITGWMVTILGFKLQISEIVFPLLFLGVLLKLFGNTRLQHIGWSFVGFSILFIGIDILKDGMEVYKDLVTPQIFPEDTLLGRLKLVLIGAAITLVTQSSSAGVATALVALGTGSINFMQAAALVIGMDIGTTFTAALATLGGSTAIRQTGFAHVIYNLLTGFMAFLLLDPFTYIFQSWIENDISSNTQIVLVAFHTSFNTLGVILVLPFTHFFVSLITRIIPDKGPPLLRRIDNKLLIQPASAIDATFGTLREVSVYLSQMVVQLLSEDLRSPKHLDSVDEALQSTKIYLQKILTDPSLNPIHSRYQACVHILDHLIRLSHRIKQEDRITILSNDFRLNRLKNMLRSTIEEFAEKQNFELSERKFERLRAIFRKQRYSYRRRLVQTSNRQKFDTESILKKFDGVRWLHRVSYHYWRINHHLSIAEKQDAGTPRPAEVEPEFEDD